MKRKLLITMLCVLTIINVFGLTACGNTNEGETTLSSQYVNLKVVERSANERILVDTDTGVLYLWYRDNSLYGQTLTPLYNEDGTLKNIADFESESKK